MAKAFTFLLFLSISIVAQPQSAASELVISVNAASRKDIQSAVDLAVARLQKQPGGQLYMINYGTETEILGRESQLQDSFFAVRYYEPRLVMVRGGFRPKLTTEFWYVPLGASGPVIDSGFRLLESFNGKIPSTARIVDLMLTELGKDPNAVIYFVSTGTRSRIARQKATVVNSARMRKYDLSRVKFRGEYRNRGIETNIWISDAGTGTKRPSSQSRLIEEFGQVSDTFLLAITNKLLGELRGKSGFEGVFLIRGNKEEAEAFEKRIRNVENFSNGIPSNVRMILRPENRKQTTVAVWIVPVGTEPPK